MRGFCTGEYAEMVSSGAQYPRPHIVRVAAREYMEGLDPSGWAEQRSVSGEDRRLIGEMLDRDGLTRDLLPEIEAYIVAASIEQCDAD